MSDNAANETKELNQWISDLQEDIESEPLLDFLERLKEPEPENEENEVEQ
jgi:hypothetical protein